MSYAIVLRNGYTVACLHLSKNRRIADIRANHPGCTLQIVRPIHAEKDQKDS